MHCGKGDRARLMLLRLPLYLQLHSSLWLMAYAFAAATPPAEFNQRPSASALMNSGLAFGLTVLWLYFAVVSLTQFGLGCGMAIVSDKLSISLVLFALVSSLDSK